jgi:hypothetical protein
MLCGRMSPHYPPCIQKSRDRKRIRVAGRDNCAAEGWRAKWPDSCRLARQLLCTQMEHRHATHPYVRRSCCMVDLREPRRRAILHDLLHTDDRLLSANDGLLRAGNSGGHNSFLRSSGPCGHNSFICSGNKRSVLLLRYTSARLDHCPVRARGDDDLPRSGTDHSTLRSCCRAGGRLPACCRTAQALLPLVVSRIDRIHA